MKAFAILIGITCQICLVISIPIVEIEQGKIAGKTISFESDYLGIEKDLDVFFGIPYAEPPVGDRRLRPPVRKEPWGENEVYNATYVRDICVQGAGSPFGELAIYNQSEDCLHLNVYVPNTKVI